jgi:hypothetical protein
MKNAAVTLPRIMGETNGCRVRYGCVESPIPTLSELLI